MIAIHLRDIDPGVVAAWHAEFGNEPSVAISCGNIFEQAADAIVSPAPWRSFKPLTADLKSYAVALSRDDVQFHLGCNLLNSMRGAARRRLN